MKSPAFQFYPADYLSSARVAEMSLEEEGAYIRALLYCWLHGSLPNDVNRLARIIGKGCSTDVATVVQRMFNENPTNPEQLVHDRLESERIKQVVHREQRSAAGRKSAELRRESNGRATDVGISLNGRATDVGIPLERNGNSSSSSSSSSSEVNTSPIGDIAHVEKTNPGLFPDAESDSKPKRFVRPSLSEIEGYFFMYAGSKGMVVSNQLLYHNAQVFFDHYEKVGWKSGKSPIKDWQAAVRGWFSRGLNPTPQNAIGAAANGAGMRNGRQAGYPDVAAISEMVENIF